MTGGAVSRAANRARRAHLTQGMGGWGKGWDQGVTGRLGVGGGGEFGRSARRAACRDGGTVMTTSRSHRRSPTRRRCRRWFYRASCGPGCVAERGHWHWPRLCMETTQPLSPSRGGTLSFETYLLTARACASPVLHLVEWRERLRGVGRGGEGRGGARRGGARQGGQRETSVSQRRAGRRAGRVRGGCKRLGARAFARRLPNDSDRELAACAFTGPQGHT